MAAKKKKTKPVPISIETDEPTVAFSLGGEVIESTVVEFHRLAMESQQVAYDARGTVDDWMPEYGEALQKKFSTKIKITSEMAYRIWDTVYNLFHLVKKNSKS